MALNQSRKAFIGGVELRGPLSLAVTQREGGGRRPRPGLPQNTPPTDIQAHDSQLGSSKAILSQADDEEVLERTFRLVTLLWDATEVRAPTGTPCEGKVVNFDTAYMFVSAYSKFLHSHGQEIAKPRITFHWTAEENLMSIIENNLVVPHPDSGIKKKHGAAFGRGIYTCPDYKMAKEDFSYGTNVTFVCLALVGRQLTRHHGKGNGLLECSGDGFDSVVGKLTNRYCDTWVIPDSSQILPCFLVDEVAIPAAVDKLREAITLLQEAWPDRVTHNVQSIPTFNDSDEDRNESSGSSKPIEQHDIPNWSNDVAPPRWRRRERSENDKPSTDSSALQESTCEAHIDELPYNGDLQAAMRAQDRPAVKLLLTRRDNRTAVPSSEKEDEKSVVQNNSESATEKSLGRRWGARASTIADDGRHHKSDDTKGSQMSGSGSVIEKAGDLLKADEEYIVHQCNCVIAGNALGIAEVIFREYPKADVYRERIERGRSHDVPGTLSIHGRIINFYAQLLPGKPADDAPPGGWPGASRYVKPVEAAEDTREARFRWFESCLSMLHRALPESTSHSIAFPARIGCGLAGGKWSRYFHALQHLARANPMWRIVVYDNQATIGASPSGLATSLPLREEFSAAVGAKKKTGFTCNSRFWDAAVFEALRDGSWQSYSDTEQETLRQLLRCCDDCDEALVDAQRNASLRSLAEAGVFPSSFGTLSTSQGSDATTGAAGNLEIRLQRDERIVTVALAPIATCGGMGEEKSQARATCLVRLRLPAVRDGELILPSDLDVCMSAPAPSECGRVVQSLAEMEALGKASGHCGICMEEFSARRNCLSSGRVIQLVCGHPFHENCLTRWFEERRRCPTCKRRFGHIVGNQPSIGTMSWKLVSDVRLEGHRDNFTILLQFRFPPGRDAAGQQYRGRTQSAYLPHDEGGKLVLELFKLAFRRRVLFDLRVSSSDGKYWPAFNIHLKTATSGGPQRFGYPDDGYYQRAMEELRENGLTVADLT